MARDGARSSAGSAGSAATLKRRLQSPCLHGKEDGGDEHQVQVPPSLAQASISDSDSQVRNDAESAAQAEEKADAKVQAAGTPAPAAVETGGESEYESEEEVEETLVVLELCDFKNHPVFDDYESATLEGIDTATPMLKIGEYALHGQLEETVGTSYFYDTDTTRTAERKYQFAGQTIKKIKFTIAPPEQP